MEVLNAAGVTPLPSFNKLDRKTEPRRLFLPKFRKTHTETQKALNGSLAVLSTFLAGAGPAVALTYDEALAQSALDGGDIGGVFDGILKFGTENALVLGGGAIALAVPLILSQILGKGSQKFGVETAKVAYGRLGEDRGAQLLDIREAKEIKESGSPGVRGLGKKSVSIVFRRDDKPGFLKKLALKFKDPENTSLYILDKFTGNSDLVAELATLNGFKAAYGIRDGAEGPRGWKKSGLPWSPAKKFPALDFGGFFSGKFGEGTDGVPLTLGLAVATGLGALAFAEIDIVLQLLGSAAIVQFATKKLLFAEDRKITLKQFDEFLNTEVAPKELAAEMKMIGKALLPISTSGTARLPAPTEATSNAPAPMEAAAEPPKEVNSIPKEQVESQSLSGQPRPLSPYPYYPDLKPPSSPAPSQP